MQHAPPGSDVVLFPMVEAARRVGISRQALLERLRKRSIAPVRRVIDGHARTFLTAEQIGAAMDHAPNPAAILLQPPCNAAQPTASLAATSVQPVAGIGLAAADSPEIDRLRRVLAEAESARVRAEAMLAAAERIERSTATRCDKLEGKLAERESQIATLREDLGEQRGLAQSLQLMLTGGAAAERAHQRKSWWGRMLRR